MIQWCSIRLLNATTRETAVKHDTARTVRETAEELGLSPATIRAWIHQRKIGYVRLGRAVRIPASEIRRLIEQGTVPPLRTGR